MLAVEGQVQEVLLKKIVVLAPGAADISEGALYLEADESLSCQQVGAESLAAEALRGDSKISVAHPDSTGFWSISPGCGDVSEGMVWVPGRES